MAPTTSNQPLNNPQAGKSQDNPQKTSHDKLEPVPLYQTQRYRALLKDDPVNPEQLMSRETREYEYYPYRQDDAKICTRFYFDNEVRSSAAEDSYFGSRRVDKKISDNDGPNPLVAEWRADNGDLFTGTPKDIEDDPASGIHGDGTGYVHRNFK